MGQLLPDGFRDERHGGMEEAQVSIESFDERPPRGLAIGDGQALVRESDLGEFDAPVAVFVPDRFVQRLAGIPEGVLAHGLVDSGHGCGGP